MLSSGSNLNRLDSKDDIAEDFSNFRDSQIFEMQLKTNASQPLLARRKTTRVELQNAMDSDSKISLPKVENRRVDCRGSIRGTAVAFGRRSRTLGSIAGSSDKEEMNIPGRFILLMAANIFLFGDYEYCLSLCSHNFSHITNTSLFEGNILRFKSLAAERFFYQSNRSQDVQQR